MNLDRPVQFRRATLSDNGFGQAETWEDHGPVHMASRRDVSDAERWRAGEVAATVTTRFVLRWSPFTADLSPKDELVSEGRSYAIVGVKEGDGRRQWVEITCSARSDQ